MSYTLIPTIICGGAGSRLWPLSRELHPKPFIRLADGQSFLQKTFIRAGNLPNVKEIFTVTNRELYFKTKDEYSKCNQNALNTSFILEPEGRNTAAAIAVASLAIAQKEGDDAFVLILPADHLILDEKAFTLAVNQAVDLANEGYLVTFGIQPDRPETGYGYIEAEGHKVIRFVEKPHLEKAQEYLDSGLFVWNSGMFCFKAKAMIDAFEMYSPEIIQAARQSLEESCIAKSDENTQIELNAHFSHIPENSIDCAIFEKSAQVAVVKCNLGWSDIGCWNALSALVPEDASGNRVEGEAFLQDVTNCYLRSQDRLIGAVGVENLFIIDTPDALLVADRSRAQDIKKIYAQLKSSNHEAYKLHRTVYRPWGTYTVLEEGLQFKIKRIEVKPGASLSLQKHYHRSEHWIVVSGMAKVVNDDQIMYVRTNESTFIPAGHKHRLENPGLLDLVMIEVQSGEYLGEDDIVRLEDTYGRVKN